MSLNLEAALIPEVEPLPGTPTLRLTRQGAFGYRFQITGPNDVVMYDVSRRFTTYRFTTPGSESPAFLYRPRDFLGITYELVDAPVAYVMATFRGQRAFDPTGVEIGKVVKAEVPTVSFRQALSKGNLARLIQYGQRRIFENEVEKLVALHVGPKATTVDVHILKPEARYMTKIFAAVLALQLFLAKTNSG